MKLIIDINEENYKRIKDDVYDTHDIHRAIISIRKGTPLDDVLNKIRAEIKFITDSNGVNHIHRDDVFKIIDKYKGEQP